MFWTIVALALLVTLVVVANGAIIMKMIRDDGVRPRKSAVLWVLGRNSVLTLLVMAWLATIASSRRGSYLFVPGIWAAATFERAKVVPKEGLLRSTLVVSSFFASILGIIAAVAVVVWLLGGGDGVGCVPSPYGSADC